MSDDVGKEEREMRALRVGWELGFLKLFWSDDVELTRRWNGLLEEVMDIVSSSASLSLFSQNSTDIVISSRRLSKQTL